MDRRPMCRRTHICSKTQQGVMGEMEPGRKRKKKSRVCVSVSSCGQYFGASKTAPWCWILTTLSFFTASSHTCMPLDSSTSTRPRYYKDRKEKPELKQIGWNRTKVLLLQVMAFLIHPPSCLSHLDLYISDSPISYPSMPFCLLHFYSSLNLYQAMTRCPSLFFLSVFVSLPLILKQITNS